MDYKLILQVYINKSDVLIMPLVRSILTGISFTFLVKSSSASHCSSILARPKMTDANETQAYIAGSASIAYVTTPDENVAKVLARGLIDLKLAACINIIPGITSIYKWDGQLNEDSEVMMMIKTQTKCIDDISKYIRENHPYEVAEVISVPIENGNPTYMDFITKSMK